jgi:predicted AAA+ superfamily ATPase
LVETFVCNELVAQLAADGDAVFLFHYRDRQQREIDFLLEFPGGLLVGIEVKAGSHVGPDDFDHLRWFEEHCGRPFRAIVLYGGAVRLNLGLHRAALPLSALWV